MLWSCTVLTDLENPFYIKKNKRKWNVLTEYWIKLSLALTQLSLHLNKDIEPGTV